MTRPDDIPEDIRHVADRIAGGYLRFDISCQRLFADVADALVAERERCAKVADQYVWDDHALAQATDIGRAVHFQSVEIAAAIRSGKQ